MLITSERLCTHLLVQERVEVCAQADSQILGLSCLLGLCAGMLAPLSNTSPVSVASLWPVCDYRGSRPQLLVLLGYHSDEGEESPGCRLRFELCCCGNPTGHQLENAQSDKMVAFHCQILGT